MRPWARIAALLLAALPVAAEPQALPFSDAVRVGDVLYLSGQIGAAPGAPGLVGGGMAAEARQAMENIGRVLRARGLGFGDVFKCTVMLTDMSRWAEFNRVYLGYFTPGRLPARSAIGAAALALGAQVEVECLAAFPASPQAIDAADAASGVPYATAVAARGLVFISGLVPPGPASNAAAPASFPDQMRIVLAKLDKAVSAAGARRSDVVKTTVFLRDAADTARMNTEYRAFFGAVRPARTTVPGVDWGRPDILVEIEAVVVAPARDERRTGR